MSTIIRCLPLIFCLIVLTDGYVCKIAVRVSSNTDKKFKAVVIVPALGIQSQPMVFEKKGTKKMQVNGKDCGKKPWIIRTYEWADNKWKPAQNNTAKYQGNGWIKMTVGDDLKPTPMERFGVGCFEGNCG
ncbi:hypothetical protein DICVIV_13023 [Dictyocaulus viviparus]|uniref:Transthyretin-like family protein n=1 Tax=Dictyocaulus viviparus TaxID=29172 RepID=A0A0D8XBI1_DICVI|nr:hypothetical protein DICVIV_13023 [Dictyocaulus viviparus]